MPRETEVYASVLFTTAHHFATGAESPAGEELGREGLPDAPQAWHMPRFQHPYRRAFLSCVDSCGAGEVTQVGSEAWEKRAWDAPEVRGGPAVTGLQEAT